jgi:hypothetical protein
VALNASTLEVDNVYDITVDQTLDSPLEKYNISEVQKMQSWAKALVQDTNNRLIDNKLSIITGSKQKK